ncbi:hypothetical protein LDENG_00214260, partial [Lucifuga dentata]
ECQEVAKASLSLLSELKRAEEEDEESVEYVEDQWNAAVQDVAAVIQSKEAQLQLVTDYLRQTQAAKTSIQRLTAQLEAVKLSPEQSSSKEVEKLSSLQRDMEENQTVLGELFLIHTKLGPYLSRSERATAQIEQEGLQAEWEGLERAVQKTLYVTNIHSQETKGLLLELSGLQEQLETIGKTLEAQSPVGNQWNYKNVQHLMATDAEVRVAHQRYLHLQELAELLALSSRWEKETEDVQQGLCRVKDQLSQIEEVLSTQTQTSSNPTMEKITKVMRDGLVWAKQTESDMESRKKRVALLPEEVHRQLRELKKLQSEVISKQSQLEALVEEVTELLPQLDQTEEVPMVQSSLECLEELSKSTAEKLARAVREIESGLQTREKLSEQIADLDSWVVACLHREASRSLEGEARRPSDHDRWTRRSQETLAEAEKQTAVCEALLMKSKDISSELSITDNCLLYDKLTNLQEDIKTISSNEKANKQELQELIQTAESAKTNLVTIEKSLRQMLSDLNTCRFPITRDSLQALEPFKHRILEHKCQVDLLEPFIPQEKTKEFLSVISSLHSKMVALDMKAKDQERYLNMRQCVEDLKENVQEQVRQTKEDSRGLEERYKTYQILLVQFPLIKRLCDEVGLKLQTISPDLYPSQLNAEQQRLNQSKDSLNTWELAVRNNLSIMEWSLLKEVNFVSEQKATQAFLSKIQQERLQPPMLEPKEAAINKEYDRIMTLKKTVELRFRALDVLVQKRQGSKSQDLIDLKNTILSECDLQMENICQARESLRSYSSAVKHTVQFLKDAETSLLPPHGSAGPCSEQLEEAWQALASMEEQFKNHVDQLKTCVPQHPYLSPLDVARLQENILSQLLVRMSTLQAQIFVRLECLSRCSENYNKYMKCQDGIIQCVNRAENSLSQCVAHKVTCLADCSEQQLQLMALCEDVESLQRHLEELKEWCPQQGCRGSREVAVAAVWKRVSRLRRSTEKLMTRSKHRITEWSNITKSMDKAFAVLEQMEAELPDSIRVKASTEELQDLLHSWEQYQEELDCEHRALSALELRVARLLGVPAHLEQAPPTPLCQELQAMQRRYSSVKQRSKEGLEASRLEVEEREKVRKELQGVWVWLEAADSLLSEMELCSSPQEIQEVHVQLCTQKAVLQHIMDRLRMKYTDMYSLVPVEIKSQLQEVTQSLKQVEEKVSEAVERSGPVHRLGAKLSEIQVGLKSVQNKLEQRSPSVAKAKSTQKVSSVFGTTWMCGIPV